PQSEMQCASSTTRSPVAAESLGRTWSRKSGLFSRSGLRNGEGIQIPGGSAALTWVNEPAEELQGASDRPLEALDGWVAGALFAATPRAMARACLWVLICRSSSSLRSRGPSHWATDGSLWQPAPALSRSALPVRWVAWA